MSSRPKTHSASPNLETELPSHWGTVQRTKNTVLFYLIRFLYSFISFIPYFIARRLGTLLGYLGYWLAILERRKAMTHLALAFPNVPHKTHKTTVRAMFVHLGQAVAEITHIDALIKHPDLQLSEEQHALIQECINEEKGVIAVTGHLGNWELLAHVLAAHSLPVNTIAKPVYDPRLTQWVDRVRSRFGLRVIWRGRQSGIKEMLRVFRSKEILALLIDQDTRVQSVFVPFFGKPASTPSAAGVLALRTGAPILLGWLHRTKTGYKLHFERFTYKSTDDKDADILAITAGITQRLESGIRQVPSQWVWMHRRWKTQPGENSDTALNVHS